MVSQATAAWPLMKTDQIDGIATDLGNALQGQKRGEGKVLVRFADIIRNISIYFVSATDEMIRTRPETVRAFVAAYLETLTYAKEHRDETIKIAGDVMKLDPDITAALYDVVIPHLKLDGRFNDAALQALGRSLVELKLLDTVPDMHVFYTDKFLPRT
jgi:NitT/TauT family transport system substrate-binding protein